MFRSSSGNSINKDQQLRTSQPVTAVNPLKKTLNESEMKVQGNRTHIRIIPGINETNDISPNLRLPTSGSSMTSFTYTEAWDEDIKIGTIPCVNLYDVSPKQQPKLQRPFISRSLNAEIGNDYKSTRDITRRRIYSRKNPHRSSDQIYIRSNVKKFLASTSIEGRSSLNIEIGPPKVLLVEDNSLIREAFKVKLFEACRWEPDVANNGAEALQMYKDYAALNYKYTAIFMDTTMPVMDGYTATKRIRTLELTNCYTNTRIIGLLSSFEKDSEQDCLSSGMDFVGKD